MIIKVARSNLANVIDWFDGKFFTVTFTKKDGTERVMNCRRGVRKNLKGGVNTVEGSDKPYRTVWDTQKQAYRAINLDTVKTVNGLGVTYVVD